MSAVSFSPRPADRDRELAVADIRLEQARAKLGPVPVRHERNADLSPEGVAARMALLAAELAAIRGEPDEG